MFCRKCGVSNSDDARHCVSCGDPLLPIQTEQRQPYYPPDGVPNYLVRSILSTVLCCQILGIVAIVYSAQVNSKLAAGDYEGAARASKNAKNWSWAAFGTGLAYYLIYGGFVLFGFLAQSAKH